MGMLYVVGTPIGNLGDLSPRAIEALNGCDFIAAEDTRVTMKLLNHFGIRKPLVSYFEHNKLERGEQICARLAAGETACLVTDAGMPAVSDPGEDLVRLCHENGLPVTVVPGPCAFVSALALSGLPAKRFCFEGFLSVNKVSRREHLAQLKNEPRTMCFYEAPHKLANTLKDMLEAFGDRPIALVREITKIHEEVIHTTLAQAADTYADNSLKGEIVLIVAGAAEEQEETLTLADAVAQAKRLMEKGVSISEAAKLAAKASRFKKGEIYKELLEEETDA
ncbi:MAG: 16S rRNA (cytidine(1402)-2'-O)-methyltransferase [Clostridia bacterium]|nr:16S rRNA (cytidine(1402)-2'-O)-methyltransferase [Clostridia bacterium]